MLAAFLCQGTWALAGVTGNIAGTVKDTSGAPVAGVQVAGNRPLAVPIPRRRTRAGISSILSLAPDTYTINLTKSGISRWLFPGVTVFADQTQTGRLYVEQGAQDDRARDVASGASLVKVGVGGDLYSVNSAQARSRGCSGGGGNLNNAYSAMALGSRRSDVAGRHGLGLQRRVRPRPKLLLHGLRVRRHSRQPGLR